MPHSNRTLSCLTDVHDSADAILTWAAGHEFDDYEKDRLLRRAVEREFEIIGEALRRLRDDDPAVWDRFPDAARILAFRNRLAHGYDSVDNAVVWGIISDHLPSFMKTVEALLEGKSSGERSVT